MLNHVPTHYNHSHQLSSTVTYSHSLPLTPTYSKLLPPTPTHSLPLPLNSTHFLAYFHPLPLILNPLLLFLNPSPPTCSLSHPLPVHIQILSPNPTHHLPFKPVFSPCVLRVYVLQVPVQLCAFVFHVPMCLRISFLCILLPMSIYFTCFCVC